MLIDLPSRLRSLTLPVRGLLWADLFGMLSLMVGAVATPWWIVSHGGATDLALQGLCVSAFSLLAMPLLGPLGDRFPKRRLILTGLALYALAALLLASVVSSDRYALSWVLLAALLGALGTALWMPAVFSIAAEIVPAERLPETLSLQRSAQSMGRVLGPAVAGMVLAWSVGAALWTQLGLLLLAMLFASRLPDTAVPQGASSRRGLAAWRTDLMCGLRINWRMPLERGWTLTNFVGMVFMVPAFSMLVPLKIKELGLSGVWLGAAEAGLSLGMLLGALGGSAVSVRYIGRHATRIGATIAQGLGLALAGAASRGEWVVVALFAVGFANSCGVLVGQTHRLLAIPQAFRARIGSVGIMVMTVAGAIGPALAGLALTQWSVSTVYVAFGLMAALSAFGFLFVPDFRTLLQLDHDQVKDWYALRHPELFSEPAPLPGKT